MFRWTTCRCKTAGVQRGLPCAWLLLVAVAGGVGLGSPACRRPIPPLTGHLTVTLRSAQGGAARSLAEEGALPAGHGDLFTVDARLSAPAYIYLIWLSADGQVIPLYPWNDETLQVREVAQPPPLRRPTHFVMCPAHSSSWTLGETAGVETLLLLARRQPLADLQGLDQTLQRHGRLPDELSGQAIWWTWPGEAPDGGVARCVGRPDAPATAATEGPLVDLLKALGRQCDLVHAVQFAHREPAAGTGASRP